MNNLVAYIPIFTTIFSFYFLIKIYNHYQERRKNYLFWWTLGVLTFGLGTLSESLNVLLGWTWVRLFSPIINLYAFFFLVGGAIYSAHRYYKRGNRDAPFRGNIFIAIGGLLPGIGGSFARGGLVEVLYVTEFIGLLLIYYGYRIIRDSRTVAKN